MSDALIDELVSVTRPMPGTILIFSHVDQEKIPATTRAKVEALGLKAIPIFWKWQVREVHLLRQASIHGSISTPKFSFDSEVNSKIKARRRPGSPSFGSNAHEAIPALVKLTSSQDARVRATALKCLEQVIGPERRGSGDHYDILSSAAERGYKDLDSGVQDVAAMILIRLTVTDCHLNSSSIPEKPD